MPGKKSGLAVIAVYLAFTWFLIGDATKATPTKTERALGAEFEASQPDMRPEIPLFPEDELERPATIDQTIQFYAKKNGADEKTAYWIAWCESRLQNIPNTEGGTYGKGIYQFTQTTWNERCVGDVWNPEDNIACATRIIGKGDLKPWKPYSGHCWLPKI